MRLTIEIPDETYKNIEVFGLWLNPQDYKALVGALKNPVDTEPARHGKWVIKHRSHEFMRPSWCVCDQCGNAGDIGDNFCKHCGTKMDGDEVE